MHSARHLSLWRSVVFGVAATHCCNHPRPAIDFGKLQLQMHLPSHFAEPDLLSPVNIVHGKKECSDYGRDFIYEVEVETAAGQMWILTLVNQISFSPLSIL